MNTRTRNQAKPIYRSPRQMSLRLSPVCHAIALMLAAGATMNAHAAMNLANIGAQMSAARNAGAPGVTNLGVGVARQPPQVSQQTVTNLGHIAAALSAQLAAQQAATVAVAGTASTVPNGLAKGGLQVLAGGTWSNANSPTQAVSGGQTTVTVQQTAPQALLDWQTFNVGRQTTLGFNQQGNTNWVVMNRVTDPSGVPSQILGSIQAPGQVYVINHNGVIFGAGSQVNTGSLIVSSAMLDPVVLMTSGIYSTQSGGVYNPSFTNAGGAIVVEPGAQISTNAPGAVTAGGGYVLLMGTSVSNQGSITTPEGQTALAAGDNFVIRPGFSTVGNASSTTDGNEIAVQLNSGSGSGTVSNTGTIQAPSGDITLVGHAVTQGGVAIATTSVSVRGTIHLLNSASDSTGSVTLTPASVTAITPDTSGATALPSQQQALISDSATQDANRIANAAANAQFDDLSLLADREDQSRVEIVTGGTAEFQGSSLTMAQGGQIAVAAAQRVQIDSGANLDVSGTQAVLPMSANALAVSIEGAELADAPTNRDTKNLNSDSVTIDTRNLQFVPAGSGGDASARYYTQGGLLEVSGELGDVGQTIDQWSAPGGTITLATGSTGAVVSQTGSTFNLSGGALQYQAGNLAQSWLLGADGHIYNVNTAPASIQYVGIYKGFVESHPAWGVTKDWLNPLIAPSQIAEAAYTVGKNAGSLILSTPTAVFEGDILAGVTSGAQQTVAPVANGAAVDMLAQNLAPLPGTLALGQYALSGGGVDYFDTAVTFGADPAGAARLVSLGDPIPDSLVDTAYFDAAQLSSEGLGGLSIRTGGALTVNAPLTLAPGGAISLVAPTLVIGANLTARSGDISIGNIDGGGSETFGLTDANGLAQATLSAGVTLSTEGLWSNVQLDPRDLSGLAFVNGGNVTIDESQGVTLAQGSVINASAGAAILPGGKTQGGAGGDITLIADDPKAGGGVAPLILNGAISAYGVTRGGVLTIETGQGVYIADQPILTNDMLAAGQAAPVQVVLSASVTYQAGQTLPMTYVQTFSVDGPGQSLPVPAVPTVNDTGIPITLGADWTLPPFMYYVQDYDGDTWFAGDTVPAGTLLYSFGSHDPSQGFPAGYVIPANVFPQGVPIYPAVVTTAAQTVLAAPITIAAGTVVPNGTVFNQPVAIQPLLNLPTATFSGGFSSYAITGQNGVTVAPGAQVEVREPVYRVSGASNAVPTGADPAVALTVWTPPLYQPNAATAVLTQRAGASLTLNGIDAAASGSSGGPVTIGAGALVAVDPGQSIDIASLAQVTIDGTLRAPGGAISIIGTGGTDNSAAGQSIWLGADAVLDASAHAATALDQSGRTYGVVPNGGSITLGAAGDTLGSSGLIDSSYDFIVVRPGALLDASGTSALIDLDAGTLPAPLGARNAGGALLVASHGGSIALSSYSGIYADGTLRAAAGGAGAAGGMLALTLETPGDFGQSFTAGSYDLTGADYTPRVLTLSQSPLAPQLAADLQPDTSDASLAFGQARFSVETLEAGGFGALSFTARDAILFDGDVNLSAAQSIAFHQGALADSRATGNVAITAPYVLLDGNTGINTNVITVYPSLWSNNWQPSTQRSTGLFSVDASLIDISNQLTFGIDSPATSNTIGTQTLYDYAGFATVDLQSQGDIRFLPQSVLAGQSHGTLASSGDLTFTAAQLYPVVSTVLANGIVTPVQVTITAGAQAGGAIDPDGVISIGRISAADPAMPDTMLGSLTFSAGTINQGGVVRAPLGDLAFNAIDQVNLLPGSLTSTSMNGLTMLFGGTADGVTWTYDGAALSSTTSLEASFVSTTSPYNIVTLNGPAFNVAAGATIDVSGGGNIAGASFIAGEGGSVNVLATPLINANPANRFSAAGNPVYAIVPGYQSGYAPLDPAAGAAPAIGQQITVPAGVPGLPAGTYTLLPASYALLPGGYRVELGGTAPGDTARQGGAVPTGNGSFLIDGYQGVANTGVRAALATQLIVMPGSAVRDTSDYDETNYSAYQIKLAASLESIRPTLPIDAGVLDLRFNGTSASGQLPLAFDGSVLFAPGTDAQSGASGQPGSVDVSAANEDIEVYAGTPTRGFEGLSLNVADLDNIAAPSLSIANTGFSGNLTIDSGVDLKAAQVLLISAPGGTITLEPGAMIDTIGMGVAPVSLSGDNAIDDLNGSAELVVSNGDVNLLYSTARDGSGNLILPTITIGEGAGLYSQGSIAFGSGGPVTIADTAAFGTANLGFSADDINIGNPAAMAMAAVPPGLNLSQARLEQLLAGDTSIGAPALQTLTLTASQSLNVFGTVDLDVIDPATGKADLNLVLNTPAIYGYGGATDTATLRVGTLTWSGIPGGSNGMGGTNPPAAPGPIIANGPGTGAGVLNIVANQITFGFPGTAVPDNQTPYERSMVGFSSVNLIAPLITSNGRNTLTVYQAAGADPSGPGVGGNLNLDTALLTGTAQSIMGFTAGGVLSVAPPAGTTAATPGAGAGGALGAEIDLAGGSIAVAGTILLPSGKLTLAAAGDITLQPGADLALAGQATTLVDQTEYSWGGTVSLQSSGGNIMQAPGATIDVSAVDNNAGSITVQATGQDAGRVALNGTLLGRATLSPGALGSLDGGTIDVAAQTLASGASGNLSSDFAALNTLLNADGFSGSRSFDLKQGDLAIGDELQAHDISVSIDNGSLTVNGTINASGVSSGSISLAALNNVTLNGTLDAHGTALSVDSYGNPIDAENGGNVTLSAVNGLLSLGGGSTIDVSVTSPQGQLLASQGDIELNASRAGRGAPSATGANAPANATGNDVNISAAAPLNIKGAARIALNAFATYTNARPDPADANGQIIDQAYLNEINTDSQAFMAAAGANPALPTQLAGLAAYGAAFHLRPGVEIASATPGGDLTVQGDVDLSSYRFSAPPGDGLQTDPAVYGSGEPGVLVLRAGGNLSVGGSVSDGFGVPPSSPDDNGWQVVVAPFVETATTYPTANFTLAQNWTIPDDAFYQNTDATIFDTEGHAYSAGQTIPAGATIDYTGSYYGIPFAWEAGITVPASFAAGPPRPVYALAPMLPAGDLSWSIQLVAGADTGAASSDVLQPLAQLGTRGNLTLNDPHTAANGTPTFSVIRTGTGSLSLAAGGDIDESSAFGIYTAGTQSVDVGPNGSDPTNLPRGLNADGSGTVLGFGNASYEAAIQDYQAYYPTGGGNLLMSAQGDFNAPTNTSPVGSWLWSQGGTVAGQPAAWWINFGTYALACGGSGCVPAVTGFNQIGTLGGGNVTLDIGGNADGLAAAVGSTGRVMSDGTLRETGGGVLTATIGGALNDGFFTGLRGDTVINAGAVGAIVPAYGAAFSQFFSGVGFSDPRYIDPLTSDGVSAINGGLTVDPGDGSVTISARGDLVLADAGNPGLSPQQNTTPFVSDGVSYAGGGQGWFSLWTDATAVNLFSAGGNLVPTEYGGIGESGTSAGLYIYPSTLNAVAASGSIYVRPSFTGNGQPALIELAPAPTGQLNLLAQGSIIGVGVAMSGADPSVVPTPFNPAFLYVGPYDPATGTAFNISNLSPNTYGLGGTADAFFAFGADTPTNNLHADDAKPIRIYAASGNIVALDLGAVITWVPSPFSSAPPIVPSTWYIGAKAADIVAGGDIVLSPTPTVGNVDEVYGFILNDNLGDVSLISAGRNLIYSGMQIGGPGQLLVEAGGNDYAGNQASITSLGPVFNVNPYVLSGGAGVTVMAGVGANGPDYSNVENLYLNPANQADAAFPDTDPVNAGKVPMTYQDQLYAWLQQRYGYSGDEADALTYFKALPVAQQSVFVLEVYFDELNASGLEFNDPTSKRFNSYLRGKDVIAALFPNVGSSASNGIDTDTGDITMFGPSGIHTEFGGGIQTLTPGGQTIVGINGANPPGTAGIITQGSGDIDMYSDDSISLGQSRVMTTFGGNIVMWSATGNIDAGLGSKTTVVFTPARRIYDDYGNVALSPTVPSTGAGIAALNPISGVPPADVNLVAPEGIVDAGEAGIRVSGNLNVAALHVENAANIQVQGKTTGVPVAATVNTGALTAADSATTAVTQIAQNLVRNNAQGVSQRHWIITVQVEGFGDANDAEDKKRKRGASDYHASSPVAVLGFGGVGRTQNAYLTKEERGELGFDAVSRAENAK